MFRLTSSDAPSVKNNQSLRQAKRLRNASRVRNARKCLVESLEPRSMMACDLYTLGSQRLEEKLDFISSVVEFASEEGSDLPLVGDKLAELGNGIDKVVPKLVEKIGTATEEGGAAGLKEILYTLLNRENGELPILGDRTSDGKVNKDDVYVDASFSASACTVTVGLRLTKELAEVEIPSAKFSLGLDALPFEVTAEGGLKVKFGFDYKDLFFTISSENGVTIDTSGANELTLSAEVTLDPNSTLDADIGFLHARVTDGAMTNVNGNQVMKHSKLNAAITVDISQDQNGFSAKSDFVAQADVALHIAAEVDANFPSISTDFVMHWSGFGDKAPAPTVAFQNLSVNMGDMVSEFLSPVVDAIKKTAEPLMPIVDFLTEPIPVLTDLSKVIGGGDVSILTLAGIADNFLPSGYKEIVEVVEVVVQVLDVVDQFKLLEGDVIFNVGDFDLSGNGDLRKAPKAFSISDLTEKNLTNLLMNKTKVASIEQKIKDGDLPDEIKTPLLKVLDRFSSGVNYEFPLFKNPVGAIGGLFLGQDADLFKLTVNYKIDSSMDLSAPIPIGIDVGLKGNYNLDTKIEVGYDTFGLRKFIAKGRAAGNNFDGDDLFDGIYISQDTHINLDGGIAAQVGIDYLLFEANVSGGLQGGIHLSMPTDLAPLDAFPDNNESRIRPFSEIGECLFAADGNLSAQLQANARLGTDFIGIEETFVFAQAKLLDFDVDCVPNPFHEIESPNIALFNPATGTLTLNTVVAPGVPQPNYPLRVPHPEEINEHYTLTLGTPQAGDPPNLTGDIVIVSAFGTKQRFVGVKTIVANAGSGDDVIEFVKSKNNANDFTAEIRIHGNAGNDSITYKGTGKATIYGDEGDDYIVGGNGGNQLFGGQGTDTLKGGASSNWINGGEGDDTLVGGNGENHLGEFAFNGVSQLENGNDRLIGGKGLNFIYAGNGNDELLAGPMSDILDGGFDDDLLVAGTGTGTFLGNRGNDHITWKVGDGRPVQIDGGTSNEKNTLGMIGSTAAETLALSKDPGSTRLMISGLTATAFFAEDVQIVDFEGQAGLDQITVETLAGTVVRDVGLNLGDVLKDQKGLGDGVADKIHVSGNASSDNVTIETEISKIRIPPGVNGTDGKGIIYGGIMRISGLPTYVVHTANVKDDLNVNALAGNDIINVNSITGPTRITDLAGNDVINVFAKKSGKPSDPLNLPDYLAELSIDAGSGVNKLNVDQSGSLIPLSMNVTSNLITSDLLPGVSYVATNGNFAGGVTLSTGAFKDKVNIRNTLPQVTTSLATGANDDTIQVGSGAPDLVSNLAGIAGALNIDAGAGNNTLTLFDRTTSSGNVNVVVTPDKITGFAGPADNSPISYAATLGTLSLNLYASDSLSEQFTLINPMASVTINAGAGNDRVIIPSLSQSATILGGLGDDTVNVGSIFNNLDAIKASIKFAGQQGTDTLNILDSTSAVGRTYNVMATAFQRAGGSSTNFDTTLEFVNVSTGAFDDVVAVLGSPVAGSMNLTTGAGNDTLQAANTLNQWDIQSQNGGKLNNKIAFAQTERLIGGNQVDTFKMMAGGSITGQINGGGGLSDKLDCSALTTSQVFNVQAHAATNIALWDGIEFLQGGSADDRLVGPNLPSNWKVDGFNSGALTPIGFGSLQFGSIENLQGGTSNDGFQIGASASLSGRIVDQGGSNDRLDYSQWTLPVSVNLTKGSATQIASGAISSVTGIDSITGGAGNDTLVGNSAANTLLGGGGNDILAGLDGDDTLIGDSGNDVMIGGNGSDILQGGVNDDLMIGNRTIYDSHDVALGLIMKEWSSAQSYGTRILHLRSGGAGALNGGARLSSVSVLNDGAKDTMTGGSGADWYWGTFGGLPDVSDLATDKQALELLN